jgi:hypothetical protein
MRIRAEREYHTYVAGKIGKSLRREDLFRESELSPISDAGSLWKSQNGIFFAESYKSN